MSSVVVVGAQWGDEGKGKIVDWLSARADMVVRFQGGHNAGHTLVVDGREYKLRLLPSGIVRGGKMSVIGNGVVIDPFALFAEIDEMTAKGLVITPDTLRISETAHLILPIHPLLDGSLETSRGGQAIGTTRRGIGPAYEDKVARRGIRVCDLFDDAHLASRIDDLLRHHEAMNATKTLPAWPDHAALLAQLGPVIDRLRPFAGPVWRDIGAATRRGQKILFEGAQGVMLDIDHGTYPYVTSSNTVAGQAAAGSGASPRQLTTILGIAKAYTTRVGSGPFPTEQHNDVGETLGRIGREFGTNTGRKRRCGWFDAVQMRQSVAVSGISGLVVTKLDVLDDFDTIRIATHYRLSDGSMLDYLPPLASVADTIEPVYEDHPGWKASTRGARSWAQLPAEAIKFIRRIEELVQCPVAMLSTSPEREDTILVNDPFAG